MGISKKIRFEVFKRDSFTCQYCGREAPEIILEIDHIEPKSKGGKDDLFNLITSCYDCNRGKRNKRISDRNEIKKQKEELNKLNKRREQLEFLLQWRNEVSEIIDNEIDAIESIFKDSANCNFNPPGKYIIKKLIKRYGFEEVLDATDKSLSKYYDARIPKSEEKAFDYISRICETKKRIKNNPELKDLYYIRGIARNRFNYLNEKKTIIWLTKLFNYGVSIDTLKNISLNAKNWTQFRTILENKLEEFEKENEVEDNEI